MKLAQIDASSYTTNAQPKQCWSVGEKKQRRPKNTVYLQRTRNGCFTKMVKSSLRYDFALKPEYVSLPLQLVKEFGMQKLHAVVPTEPGICSHHL